MLTDTVLASTPLVRLREGREGDGKSCLRSLPGGEALQGGLGLIAAIVCPSAGGSSGSCQCSVARDSPRARRDGRGSGFGLAARPARADRHCGRRQQCEAEGVSSVRVMLTATSDAAPSAVPVRRPITSQDDRPLAGASLPLSVPGQRDRADGHDWQLLYLYFAYESLTIGWAAFAMFSPTSLPVRSPVQR